MKPFCLTLFTFGVLGLSALAESNDWPIFRGGVTQTGVSTAKLPEKMDILWEFKTKDAIEGGAVIVDGIVYFGSYDQNLYAVELKSGKQKWATKLGPIKAPPAIHKGRIYVGDVDGKFYALELATGKVLWKFETEDQITASANFFEDRILIPSHDSTVYCLDQDGKKVWEFRTDGPIFGSVPVAKGMTFVAGCDSNMHAVDLKTGKKKFSVDLKGQTGASAAVVDNTLYVGTMTNQVLAVDLMNEKISWEFEAPKRKAGFYSSPAVVSDLVVIGSRDSKVWAIERNTGKSVWDFQTDRRVDSSPLIVGNRVFIGSSDENFYILDLKTGKNLQSFMVDSPVICAPAAIDGYVIFGTEKGTLYCLGAKKD